MRRNEKHLSKKIIQSKDIEKDKIEWNKCDEM